MKRFATLAASLAIVVSGLTGSAAAQCATCPQPTVALSPVVQQPVVAQPTVAYSPVAVQQPVVLQSVPPRPRLFDGRILRWIFGTPTPVAVAPAVAAPPVTTVGRPMLGGNPTFVTAAYQPTYPMTAAVAVPTFQTVARPVALTTYRPVTMAPACCPTPTCCPTSGVTTASFDAPVSSCPNCASSATTSTFSQPYTQPYTPPAPTPAAETPQPQLDPAAPVPDQRLRPLPDNSLLDNGPASPASPADGSGAKETFDFGNDSDVFWQAPQLFNPNARTTSRPAAPVWNAVYQQDGRSTSVRQTVYQVGPDASAAAPRRQQQGTGGWRSVQN